MAENRILTQMLDRLFAAMVNGPAMNCRPHASRQRVDLTQLGKLRDRPPGEILTTLLGAERSATVTGKVPAPKRMPRGGWGKKAIEAETQNLTPEEQAALRAWTEQQSTLTKLRLIAEDAKVYEQDTGVGVLSLGFPLLSLPPGTFGGNRGLATRRVMAPIAFVPLNLVVQSGAKMSVQLSCRADGTDLVMPNASLLAWLEQQTGVAPAELFSDEEGENPWREICELVRHTAKLVDVAPPAMFDPDQFPEQLDLLASPKADEDDAGKCIIPSAVLGLFPLANQGLLRDSQAMAAGEALVGPVTSFVQVGAKFDQPPVAQTTESPQATQDKIVEGRRNFADDRFVSAADPCQARAVRLARTCRGMVIHGPPGTGKSQTITNIIGDHLMRDQRVLFVCDKRTALDVVYNRLEHLGLGNLCALIHDPQRDQRELYRSIREQLEALPDAKSDARAEKKLAKIDEELTSIHAELTRHHQALMSVEPQTGFSFHDMVGHWLAIADDPEIKLDAAALASTPLIELEKHETLVDEVLKRAASAHYATNPWRQAAGIALDLFLSRPMDEFRAAMQRCASDAEAADETADPAIPPFASTGDLIAIGEARVKLADRLEHVLANVPADARARWASRQPIDAVERMRKRLGEHAALIQLVQAAPLDPELSLAIAANLPPVPQINQDLSALAAYLEVARKWYAIFAFGRKSAAANVLNRFGLTLSAESAERVSKFLTALRARLALQMLIADLTASGPPAGLVSDEALVGSLTAHQSLLGLLSDANGLGLHQNVATAITPFPLAGEGRGEGEAHKKDEGGRMKDESKSENPIHPSSFSLHPYAPTPLPQAERELIAGLRKSPARAAALVKLETSLASSRLLDARWLGEFSARVRNGDIASRAVQDLADQLDTVESVLRVRGGLAQLPPGLGGAIRQCVEQGAEPQAAVGKVRRTVLASEIIRRLTSDPQLQQIDAQRMKIHFERFRQLEEQKRDAVQAAIVHRWTTRQRDRLLVGTESRLNSTGADIRRRLTMRGERAMRLRQVIAVGEKIEGGDPLFDLRPIWMASPETVAQIFPRRALFDVIVFDEASQCRLEEALPVLTRGQRVVIAGDPRQLPPTRFFETAIASSDDDGAEIETDQDLFEIQQSETEDLLAAALGLDIQQSYLDVHYRSRNADLIGFSNEYFYGNRLQAIPGHPSNRRREPPITLYQVNGVYEDRCNEAEAQRVCQIVRDLLKRAKPPSIGVACFNLTQRDLIVEKLDELAEEDDAFARKLAAARELEGAGSFEGLFVKNLENVQGDERDHIIISTTYGPDPKGKFRRNFGPLGRAGGGRRLNVLVTRARHEVHLVSSIPPNEYRALPPVPPGQSAGGTWLVFAYLAYAEALAQAYAKMNEQSESPSPTEGEGAPRSPSPLGGEGRGEGHVNKDEPGRMKDEFNSENPIHPSSFIIHPSTPSPLPQGERGPEAPASQVQLTKTPSAFAEALANRLASEQRASSEVYWGNDGFGIDLAMQHPTQPQDVTIGVLCDGSRFGGTDDPVEWDIFRTGIHESQGWTLHRLWTPSFFRDPSGHLRAIAQESRRAAQAQQPKDSIRVSNKT